VIVLRPQEKGKLKKWFEQQIAKVNTNNIDDLWFTMCVWDGTIEVAEENLTYKEGKEKLKQKLLKRFPFLRV